MNTLCKSTLAAALTLTTYSSHADTITSFVFTGGTFDMSVFTPQDLSVLGGTANIIGLDDLQNWDHETPKSTCVSDIACFDFNDSGKWMNVFMSSTNSFGTYSTKTNAPNTLASGEATLGGSITLDLDALWANWNGVVEQNWGGTATGSCDLAGNCDISWTSQTDSPFGPDVTWNMSGIVEVSNVPVPGTIWLMASGLAGLMGTIRRKA